MKMDILGLNRMSPFKLILGLNDQGNVIRITILNASNFQ
jgi:hypothetical protein